MTRSKSTQRGASRRNAGGAARTGTAKGAAPSRARSSKPSAKAKRAPARTRVSKVRGPWVPIAAVAAVIALAWTLYPAIRLDYQMAHRASERQAELAQLSSGNAALRSEVNQLKTPAGVEKEARESLGYAKKGDNVYVVVPPDSKTSDAADMKVASTGGVEHSLLDRILDALFGVAEPTETVEP